MYSQDRCPKCGFSETFTQKFKMEYKENCYSRDCKWEDDDVKEHLHVICPTCEYMLKSIQTKDYEQLKKGDADAWTTATDVTGGNVSDATNNATPVTTSQPRVISRAGSHAVGTGAGSTRTPISTPKSAWDTECGGCPCSEEKAEETDADSTEETTEVEAAQ